MSDDKKDYYGEEAFSHLPADYGQRCTDNFRREERVMSDGKEVKRWVIPNRKDDFGFSIAVEKNGFTDEQGYGGYTEVMPVADHDRIVAELNAKYKKLSDFNDACRKVRYRQEGELAELNARLDKVNDVYKMWVKELETIAELRAEVERLKGKLLTVTTMESNYKMLQGELTESRAEVEALKTTVANNRLDLEWPIVKQLADAETTIARQAREVEDLKSVQEALIETAKKNQDYYEFEYSRFSKLLATRARVIEKLREQRDAWIWGAASSNKDRCRELVAIDDKELAAIEKEGAKDE